MSTGAAVEPTTEAVLATAQRWLDKVSTAPEAAARRAHEWLSCGTRDPEVRVVARHLAALAAVERGRVRDARRHVRLGLSAARRAGLAERAAQLRLTSAWIEFERGAVEESTRQLAAAADALPAAEVFRFRCLRGLLACRADRYDEAVAELTAAMRRPEFRRQHRWAANALVGRGTAHLYTGRWEQAEADFFTAERLLLADGSTARAAACRHNQGCVALRSGDLPRALRLFEQAAPELDLDAVPETLVDRAEAFAAAGLDAEARSAMERAATRLERHGRAAKLAETRLGLAGCALRSGDVEAAAESAALARRLFRQQRRPAWVALAAAVEWRAKLLRERPSRHALAAARRAGAACAGHGWPEAAAELWLTAAHRARQAGAPGTARTLLRLVTGAADRTGSARLRLLGRVAAARLAEQAGDLPGLFRTCWSGLREVEAHAAALGAFELRVHVLGLAEELGELLVGAALRTGDPQWVLRCVERARTGVLHRRSPAPAADAGLTAALADLRAAVVGTRTAPDRHAEHEAVAALEGRVRRRALLADGGAPGSGGRWCLDEVVDRLGGAVLLNLFAHGDALHALVVADGEVALHRLGSESGAEQRSRRLRYFLARRAELGALRFNDAYRAGAKRMAAELQDQLLGPVLPALVRGRPLVVVPTGRLHALPWAALPDCRGRPVTVTPSLPVWLRAARDARAADPDGDQVWIAGPGLEHAAQEVGSLHRASGGTLLVGPDATAARAMSTADGAATVHIAAHGRFRDDRPLLSCVDLADGPLYAYDLDRLPRGPATVVLSACEVGQSAVRPGDQISGLAATLLGRGTATVIASVVPVPDERTAAMMETLHSALRRGTTPATALAAAQAEHGESGFLCIGYGGERR
ncbi:CHAT domain-containing protein [Saccharopolyspora cebuensis]|uniref:CHAT domain-containing protein n=1 Tax=Saccharopolyspora cebuensis TaxID=418759 RepID=A0ABV4CK56_9PSEU